MALRLVAQRAFRNGMRNFATVQEQSVKITFVDQSGRRATFPGRIGSSLLDCAVLHNVAIDGACKGSAGTTKARRTEKWVEYLYGEGLSCGQCHVQISPQYNHLLPEKFPEEVEALERTWEETVTPTSRCACNIVLEKKHEGMVVLVPDQTVVDVI